MNANNLMLLWVLALTIVSQAITLAVQMIRGGFRMGRLTKELELDVPANELDDRLREAKMRLALLGFKRDGETDRYIQPGMAVKGSVEFTHAKTKKQLTLATTPRG